MRFVVVLLAVLSAAAAELKLPRELEQPTSMAMSAPPEFAASALLRIIESGRVTDKKTAMVLLDQAFSVASQAHFRVAMRAAGAGAADTRSASLAKAYALGLDATSLQSRAVLLMMRWDPARAREMFQSISQPEVPALTCKDALLYDPGAFYQALGAVASGGFTAKERARQDHVSFLLQFASAVHGPAQLGPMIGALQQAGLTGTELQAVQAALGTQMENMSSDPHSYEATLNDLKKTMPPELAASFQKYSGKDQTSAACNSSDLQDETYWQSAAAQQIMLSARKLRFGDGTSQVLSDSDRTRSEWKQKLVDFEKDLANWDPAGEKSEADYYQQKCIVFEALVELIPAGPERDAALASFFAFANSSNLSAQSPAEWFMPIAQMLERIRNTNDGEPEKVLSAMDGSGNPALLVYAALERLLDAGHPSWVSANGSGR